MKHGLVGGEDTRDARPTSRVLQRMERKNHETHKPHEKQAHGDERAGQRKQLIEAHCLSENPQRFIWVTTPRFQLGYEVNTNVGNSRIGWVAVRGCKSAF